MWLQVTAEQKKKEKKAEEKAKAEEAERLGESALRVEPTTSKQQQPLAQGGAAAGGAQIPDDVRRFMMEVREGQGFAQARQPAPPRANQRPQRPA